MLERCYASGVAKIVLLLFFLNLVLFSSAVFSRASILATEGYVSGQLSRVNLDRNQSNAFGKIYIGEILLGHNSATFISIGNQPQNLVTNPWRFCFEKDEYDEIEDFIGSNIVLEFKTPRKGSLLSCTSINELEAIYPVKDDQDFEQTHLTRNIRTTDSEFSHGVEFGRIINVIENKNMFNFYFMTIQVGSSGSKFRHFVIDNSDMYGFSVQALQADVLVKVHYSERLSRRNLFGLNSMSYVSELEIVDQDETN